MLGDGCKSFRIFTNNRSKNFSARHPCCLLPDNLLDSLRALGFSILWGQETHRWNGAATWYGTSGHKQVLFWNFHEFPVILLASVGTSCGKIERNGSGFTGAFRFRWIHGGFASLSIPAVFGPGISSIDWSNPWSLKLYNGPVFSPLRGKNGLPENRSMRVGLILQW